MTWDDQHNTGDELEASEWNNHVDDQKNHSQRHEAGGDDEISLAGMPGIGSHGADYSVVQRPRDSGDYECYDRDGENIVTSNDFGVVLQNIHDDALNATNDDYSDGISVQLSGGWFSSATPVDFELGIDMEGRGRNRTYVATQGDYLAALLGTETWINEFKNIKFAGGPGDCFRVEGALEFNATDCEWRDFSDAAIYFDMPAGADEIWAELTGCWLAMNGDNAPTNSRNGGLVIDNPNSGAGVSELNINGGILYSQNSTYAPCIRVNKDSGVDSLNISSGIGRGYNLIDIAGGNNISISDWSFKDVSGDFAIRFGYDHSSAFQADHVVENCQFISDPDAVPTRHIEVGDHWRDVYLEGNMHSGSVGTAYWQTSAAGEAWVRNLKGADEAASYVPSTPDVGSWYIDDGSNVPHGTRTKRIWNGGAWETVWTAPTPGISISSSGTQPINNGVPHTGIVRVTDGTNDAHAAFLLGGDGGGVTEIADPDGHFGTASGSGNSIDLVWNGTDGYYQLENTTGSSVGVDVTYPDRE